MSQCSLALSHARKEKELLDNNDCLNNVFNGTLGKVILDTSKEKNIGIVATTDQDLIMWDILTDTLGNIIEEWKLSITISSESNFY